MNQLIDVRTAATLTGYSVQTVRAKARNGELRAVRRGRAYFFDKAAIEELFRPVN